MSTGRPAKVLIAIERRKNARRLAAHPREQRRVTRRIAAQSPFGAWRPKSEESMATAKDMGSERGSGRNALIACRATRARDHGTTSLTTFQERRRRARRLEID